jgi:cytochrome c peroxidase
VTRNSPYDRFVLGEEGALDNIQKRGLVLFFTKAKCAACHSGPMFSDFRFVVQGVPQEGDGKEIIPGDDTGREEFTLASADRYAFRTLTLRNVELTAPYMHDGVFETLEEVVQFYNDGAQPRHPAVSDELDRLVSPLNSVRLSRRRWVPWTYLWERARLRAGPGRWV